MITLRPKTITLGAVVFGTVMGVQFLFGIPIDAQKALISAVTTVIVVFIMNNFV